MESALKEFASDTALIVAGAAVAIIAFGAASSLVKLALHLIHGRSSEGWRKELFVWFGIWLLLGLQFALAADVVTSVIAPTWTDIGQLAAIAGIRTFLNFFLERDIDRAAHEVGETS